MYGKESSLYAIFEYVFYAFFIFAVLYILKEVNMDYIMSIYELVGLILSAEAIWEFISGNILYRPYTDFQVMRRSYGLIGSPLSLGMVLACIAMIALHRGRNEHKFHYINGVLAIAGMICTQSRGPFVGLIVGLLIKAYIEERMKSREAGRAIIKTIYKVLFVIILLYIIVLVFARNSKIVSDLVERVQTIFVWGETGTSNYTRTLRWKNAFIIFEHYPILGYGVSSTGPHAVTGVITESGLLKKLVEIGVIGFSTYYIVYVSECFHSLKRAEKKRAELTGLAFGIITAVFVENIIMQIVESAAVYLMFSFFFGYLLISSRKNAVTGKPSAYA